MEFDFDERAYSNAVREFHHILCSSHDLVKDFVFYSNLLLVASDGDDDYDYHYLFYLVKFLRDIALGVLLRDRGYYIDVDDQYLRYRKDL